MLLAGRVPVEQVIASMQQQQYVGDADEIEQSIVQLIDELRREELLAPAERDAAHDEAARPPDRAGELTPFTPPALNKYADMEDLLLVDPVHGNIIRTEPNVRQIPQIIGQAIETACAERRHD